MKWGRLFHDSWLHPLTSILVAVVLVLETLLVTGSEVAARTYQITPGQVEPQGRKLALPAVPPPVSPGQTVTALVSPDQAAEITSPSGNITLSVPAGAVSRATLVQLTERAPWGSTGRRIVKLFELTARDNATGENVTQFSQDLTITIRNDAEELRGLDVSSLRLYYLDENSRRWRPTATSRFDPVRQVLTATTNHFSNYGEQADPLQNGPGRVLAAQVNLHSGVAVFNYPLELPPGPGGFQPKLSLTYNSGIADEMKNKRATGSWVGIGWTLHLGSLTKDLSESRFFLDLNGASHPVFTADWTNYRTNPEQYFKIVKVDPEISPDTYEVRDREGNYYQFGGAGSSVQFIGPDSNRQRYRYDLSLIRDTNNNEATVSYAQDIRYEAGYGWWVRSAYPEYLRYGSVEIRFFLGWDENDAVDGYLRRDNPKRVDDTLTPRIMETRRLDSIEIKVSGSLVRKYTFGYSTTDRVYSGDYGGIYYSGKHSLASVTQVGTDNATLPAISFSYQDLQTYRHAGFPESDYYGNPGNPASLSWPHLTRVNSGYGGSVGFAYTQMSDNTTWNVWTREVVTGKVVYSDNVSNVVTENITYTYTTDNNAYPKQLGRGWDQRYRGFHEIKETDAAGNYIKHWFYTTGTVGGKDAEKLSGREYKTQWFSRGGALLREKVYDWTAYTTSQVPDFAVLWSADGSGPGLFGLPYGIAATGDNYTYVTDTDPELFGTRHRFQKFDLHGDFIYTVGAKGTGNGQFSTPRGVAVSGNGDVYVVDRDNSRVQKFDSSGSWVSSWGNYGTGNGQFNSPHGIGISSGGYVYVADFYNNRIQKFSSSGTFISKWTVTRPVGVAVDGSGYVYVTSTNYVYKYDANGNYVTGWGGSGHLYSPRGITAPSDGYVYVADTVNNRIRKYTNDGSHVYLWDYSNGYTFSTPSDVALLSGTLYVTEEGKRRVQEIIPNWAVRLSQVDETTDNRTARVRYAYDDYGNVITEYLDGDISSDSDNATVHRVFYPNTTANILSKPARERSYATTTGDAGGSNLKKETLYYYDSAASWETAPAKGNLTRLDLKKDASNSVSSNFTYDSYGNKLTAQDPRGNTTTWSYDTTHHTYPKSKTYPVSGLSENYTYDPGTWNLTSRLDVNGENTTYEYDTFKRLTRVIKPGDSSSSPSVKYEYNSWGTLNQQHIKVITKTSASDNLTRSDYFDGLGRVMQVHAKGETGHTIVAATTLYDNRGLVDRQYVSQDIAALLSGYQAPDTGWRYTVYAYDGLGRVAVQTGADNTSVTQDYSTPWQTSKVNERGFRTDYLYDAFGRLSLVKERRDTYGFLLGWNGNGELYGAYGIAYDSQGYVYVANSESHAVHKFDSRGNFILKWGAYGTGDGQFRRPWDVATDNQSNVYVADYDNSRIQKFTDNGTFITKWGTQGTGNGQFLYPSALTVTGGGVVYVTDQHNQRIQKFDSSGGFLGKWGSYGSGDGQFAYPQGIAVDSQGYVYVADTSNNRVQKFTDSGTFVLKWGGYGTGDGQFRNPRGLTVDSQGYAYVADTENHRIQKFDSTGRFLLKWGSYGSDNSSLIAPYDITADRGGNLYVDDTGNSRVQKWEPALYATTSYNYDVLGNLTQVRDNAGNTTNMTYDWLSRKTAMTDPDMGGWSYVYDSNGNLTGQTDAKSQTITFSYDALNRLTGKTYPAGSGMTNVTYSYDNVTGGNFGKGKRTGMTHDQGTTAYTYDNRGRLIEEKRTLSSADYTTGFGYDSADRATWTLYPTSENVSYGYNGRGLPDSVSSSIGGSLVTATLYNALGQLTQISLGNSANITHGYWGIDTSGGYYGRLYEIKTAKPGQTLQQLRHTWDAGGNLANRIDVLASDTENFGYDFLDRLTSVSGNYTASYAYNEIGNITSSNLTGNYKSYTYGTRPHAVTQVGSDSYAYDANGNMTTRGSQGISWDVENRPRSVMPDFNIYYYDGDGKRVKKVANGLTIYVNRYHERNLSASENTNYYYLGDRLIALRNNSGLRYIYQDHLTGTAVTDNGTVDTTKFYPYGSTRSGSVPTDKKFTGQRLDGTGLYYYGARYYDPGIGRFISPDSIVPDFKNPQAWNKYSYVVNNPLKYKDQSGHFFETLFDILGIAYDIVELVSDPSWGNAALLGADVALAFVPFVPSGAGASARAGKAAANAGKQAEKKVVQEVAEQGAKQGATEAGRAFKSFTERNFRENLKVLTGKTDEMVDGMEAHHIFPLDFSKKQGSQFWGKWGIKVNDPKNGKWVNSKLHAQKSKEYNQAWDQFFQKNPNATADEVEAFGKKITKEIFGVE